MNNINEKQTVVADVVFVVDTGGDMGNFFMRFKKGYQMIVDACIKNLSKKRTVKSIRVRMILFNDYLSEGEKAFSSTDFVSYPDGCGILQEFLDNCRCGCGGDAAQDALEALDQAIRSDWQTSNCIKRNLIFLFTDAPAHELGYAKKSPYYPVDAPSDLTQLTNRWINPSIISCASKRLIITAPFTEEWDYISSNWENCIFFPASEGIGLSEFCFPDYLVSLINY